MVSLCGKYSWISCHHRVNRGITAALTVGLLRERLRLLWERPLTRERLLEGSAEAGGEAVGGGVAESRRHAHGTGAERGCNTSRRLFVSG